jgi:hypothetical protein
MKWGHERGGIFVVVDEDGQVLIRGLKGQRVQLDFDDARFVVKAILDGLESQSQAIARNRLAEVQR